MYRVKNRRLYVFTFKMLETRAPAASARDASRVQNSNSFGHFDQTRSQKEFGFVTEGADPVWTRPGPDRVKRHQDPLYFIICVNDALDARG